MATNTIKKVFMWGTIITLVVIGIALAVLYLNSTVSKCDDPLHVKDSTTKQCYYYNTTCAVNQTVSTDIAGNPICIYTPPGFINSEIIKWILIIVGLGWIGLVIAYVISLTQKGMYKKDQVLPVNRARELIMLDWAKRYGIPLVDEKRHKKEAFRFYYASEPTKKSDEWFVKFQMEVLEGSYQGLFTIVTTLSRGEQWIIDSNYSWKEVDYDSYKRARDWPVYSPTDPKERMLEALYAINPEKAMEVQNQMLEKGILTAPAENIPQTQEQSEVPPVMYSPRPRYRRPSPYRRRYF